MLVIKEKGRDISDVAKEVQATLKAGEYCDVELNDIIMTIRKESLVIDLCIIYDLKRRVRQMRAGEID